MRWTLWIAFVLLCILSGTSWAISLEIVGELPPLEQQGLFFGVIGLVALPFARRAMWSRIGKGGCARLAGAGVVFFGLPIVVTEYARGSVPSSKSIPPNDTLASAMIFNPKTR